MTEVYLNYREFLQNGSISGTRENDIMNYTFSSSSGDDIKNEGLYYDVKTGRWYKNFLYDSNSDGTTFYFPVLMSVNEEEGVYNFKSSAFVRQRSSDEYISKVGKACGLELWERGEEIIKRRAVEYLSTYDAQSTIPYIGIYDAEGNLQDVAFYEYINFETATIEPDFDLIDFIYDMFNEEFGDVSRRYDEVVNDFSTDGDYLVKANSDISSTVAYSQQEEMLFGNYSADQIHDIVESVKNTDSDAVRNVFNHDFVRVIMRSGGLGADSYYLHFIGYDVANNIMTFTGGNGGFTVTKSDYIEVFFKLGEDERIERTGSVTHSYAMPVYTEWSPVIAFNLWGVPSGSGSTFHGSALDMVSGTGSEKPYNLIPNYTYPTPSTLPDRVSDEPDEDEDEPTQDYWIIGKPTPKPIKVKIPIGTIPPVPHDIPSEYTVPDVSGTQSSKGLTHVYNPTDTELYDLSVYLWDTSVLTHISQIWKNNPMEGIVNCQELYFTPSTTTKQNIVLGDVTTSVESKVCTDRYQQLNCGYKYINRFWNDARDYQSKVSIYLPFIGIKELDINDVLDANIWLDYQIDIISGDCTATISLQRKNASGEFLYNNGQPDKKVLYMFDGNCAVPIPLSGADRNSLYSGVVGGALGVVGGIMSGNPFTAIGGVSSALSSKPSIEKCGNIGGNRGAMAFKKPYIIITRPIPNEPMKRGELLGKPSNKSVRLKDVKGYSKFKTVHVDSIGNASDTERDLIQTYLLNGVIL